MEDSTHKLMMIGNAEGATNVAAKLREITGESADVVVVEPAREPNFIFTRPGDQFRRIGGEEYEVRNDGSYRRLNKPVSKKKARRLDAVLRKQGSSLQQFTERLTALRDQAKQAA